MQMILVPQVQQCQQLLMSQDLRQAIKLLRMSNLELCAYIAQLAERNPLIMVTQRRIAALPPIKEIRSPEEGGLYRYVFAEADRLFPPGPERRLAHALCESLEPTGWLPSGSELQRRIGADVQLAAAVLARLRGIEPAGLFALDLRDCLRLQAERAGHLDAPMAALLDHLPELASGRLAQLGRKLGCTVEVLAERLRQLKRYDPKPGLQLSTAQPGPIAQPDLLVFRRGDGWAVELNHSTLPEMVVDPETTASRVKPSERAFLSEWLPQARWLRRSIAQRNVTVLRVGAEVVRRQAAFLEGGAEQLVPLQLRAVAEALSVHESTVSRVTAGLTVETPRGVLALRSFFSAAIGGTGKSPGDGECVAAAAVRHRIRALIAAEPPARPLSDQEIARRIADKGPSIARRTVAKYREMEGIPSSAQRLRRHRLAGALLPA